MKYSDSNTRQERKENRDRATKKARKNFRKDICNKRDERNDMKRRGERLQKIENELEFLNTGTE